MRVQSNPTRRRFLRTIACVSGVTLAASDELRAADVDPRIAQIVSRTIAVDMHNHVQIQYVKDAADARPDPDYDAAGEMLRSGLSAVLETYNIDGVAAEKAGDDYEHNLQALAFEDRLLARNHMRRALSLKDLETAHKERQPVVIQSAEGAQFIEGRLERVEEAYRRGLRNLQLVHERDDLVSPLGDVYTASSHLGGLTPFGAKVIKECNRLGIIVDLTHATYEMVRQALQVATQPVLYSHGALLPEARGAKPSADMERRLLGKDEARALADAGGVIGIWWRGVDSTKGYVENIKRMVDAIGVDHVGIGTDTDLTPPAGKGPLPHTNGIWKDQADGFFYAVAGEMLKQSFTADEIGKIGGGNFCRVFGKVTDRFKV
jgi:membrane dipeptidase